MQVNGVEGKGERAVMRWKSMLARKERKEKLERTQQRTLGLD